MHALPEENGWQFAFGEIRHSRLRPAKNAFVYPAFFLRVPIHNLENAPESSHLFAVNKAALLSFYDCDHGDGQGCARWINTMLQEAGIAAPTHIYLHCFPRVFGYSFKPVSFWFCHSENGALSAIVAEVNNTFGERHVYLLSGNPKFGQTLQADKVFHVSPFCATRGEYNFRFLNTETHTVAKVDHSDEGGPLLLTSLSGKFEPLNARSSFKALTQYPFFTFGVVLKIHWQAVRLWIKKVPFFSKPQPPSHLISKHSQ
jgi:uncharacterized protein